VVSARSLAASPGRWPAYAGLSAATPPARRTACDSPFLPADLVSRLKDALENLPVAKSGQSHLVFILVKTSGAQNRRIS
jgi:molybdopterin-guanine dinucleotide biosynthesis protein A